TVIGSPKAALPDPATVVVRESCSNASLSALITTRARTPASGPVRSRVKGESQMTGEHRVTFGTIRNSQTMRVPRVALTPAATGLAAVVGAANRFAVGGVENGTHVTIRMHHRWGDGSWTTDVLQPGGRKWFWQTYDYANENRSDRFHVRFDSDLHPG